MIIYTLHNMVNIKSIENRRKITAAMYIETNK